MDELQPPGAGLPEFERAALNFVLRAVSLVTSDSRALSLFQREANRVLEIADAMDADRASQQILVPRYQGMEDSSRNWSVLMVCHHLCLVNYEIMRVIDALKQGIAPLGEISIADYKPDADVGLEVIDDFRRLAVDYGHFVRSNIKLATDLRFPHPWFGPLDGHQWHCLAAVHQRIHRKQAQKIMALLGVV